MMSLDTIRSLSRLQCAKAAKRNRKPLIVEADDIESAKAGDYSGIKIPSLGGFVHPNFKPTGREFFVDKTGYGSEREPALTLKQFIDKLVPGKAYATVEEGPCQVYVAEYERK
jgi:hypothetical protein